MYAPSSVQPSNNAYQWPNTGYTLERGVVHSPADSPVIPSSEANPQMSRGIETHRDSSVSYSLPWGPLALSFLSTAALIMPGQFAVFCLAAAMPIALGITVLQMVAQKRQNQSINPRLWLDLMSIMVMGGIGYFVQNTFIVKLTFTIINALTGGALLLSEWFWKNALIKSIFPGLVPLNLNEQSWTTLNRSLAGVLGASAALSGVIAYTCSDGIWFCSTLGLAIFQALFLSNQFDWAVDKYFLQPLRRAQFAFA